MFIATMFVIAVMIYDDTIDKENKEDYNIIYYLMGLTAMVLLAIFN